MCGISGFITKEYLPADNYDNILDSFNESLAHRGPDASGKWYDEENKIGLAHRRLSILDLSVAASQPMISDNGNYVIVFNGEIYNHLEIRNKLSIRSFKSHSDTETLLYAFQEFGIETTLNMTVGMFALALWDRENKTLYLARDRFGEKPLYYGFSNGNFIFSSELKALKKYPNFNSDLNRESIALYFRYSYIPSPFTIYNGINKLPPGSYLKIQNLNNNSSNDNLKPIYYWNFNQIIINAQNNIFNIADNDAINLVEDQLNKTIKGQMISDVPLGAFLSGGIDSSLVVALMQNQSKNSIKTFTIGFNESNFNEAVYAKDVARHLNTDHTELYVTSKDALSVIPMLSNIYDEPFADSSQIPTYLVSKMTKSKVTVSLSGDAGDEVFGGYNRYIFANNIWSKFNACPYFLRNSIKHSLTSISPTKYDKINEVFKSINISKINNLGDKIFKFSELMNCKNEYEVYLNLVSQWPNTNDLILNNHEPLSIVNDKNKWPKLNNFTNWMMAIDTLSYLPDDILTKVDRAGMATSLETRIPFLDHNLVEMAWRLPLNMKIRNGQSKWILRQILNKYVPSELINRPKMGFGVPIDIWLRGPLKEWGSELLDYTRIKNEGYFNPEIVTNKWNEHQSGKRNWQHQIWSLLMFQSWLDNNR
jgi:asparagine synthase (glutamine-hydrolysing)